MLASRLATALRQRPWWQDPAPCWPTTARPGHTNVGGHHGRTCWPTGRIRFLRPIGAHRSAADQNTATALSIALLSYTITQVDGLLAGKLVSWSSKEHQLLPTN